MNEPPAIGLFAWKSTRLSESGETIMYRVLEIRYILKTDDLEELRGAFSASAGVRSVKSDCG